MSAPAPVLPSASWDESSLHARLAHGEPLATLFDEALAAAAAGTCVDGAMLARVAIRHAEMSRFAPGGSPYRKILDSAVDTAIIALDLQGRVTGWNEGAVRLLGWREEEIVGRTLHHVFTAEDQTAGLFAKELDDALNQGRGGHEGWRIRKDGSLFWAIGETTPLLDGGRPVGFVKVLRDRTPQQRAAEALAEQARVLAILNRTAAALARETDVDSLLQAVTSAGVALAGADLGAFYRYVAEAEGFALHALSGGAADQVARLPLPLADAGFPAGPVRLGDLRNDPRAAGWRQGDEAGMASYLAVPVVSRSGDTIGAFVFGHACPNVFDERVEELIGGLAGEAAIALDNAHLFAAAQREIEVRKRAEDALRHLNATLEQQVAERTEALRQAQKMEALGQLTGGVAHDFNNLLQIIVASLELLARNLPLDMPRLRRATDHAMRGARRAALLTQQLLAFSRRQPLDPKPLDINDLVRAMSEMMHRTLGETVAVQTALEPSAWRVEADPNELESALLNLAVNARDAMPRGGTLRIQTGNRRVTQAEANAQLPAGDYVQISVVDTGVGMDAATVAKAFEPFFTTKPVGKGTGLGLSQVYGFVKQSGGQVLVESTPGEGTTVHVLLPRLVEGRARSAGEGAGADGAAPHAAEREIVLVVEDDADVRASSVDSLRELGYQVFEAHDGPSALRLLQQPGQPVTLLFTDVVLPGGMTGAELASRARALRPDLRVLYTTGYARDAIVHRGRLDRGVQLITKPFAFADLAAKVREVLDA